MCVHELWNVEYGNVLVGVVTWWKNLARTNLVYHA